MAPKNDFQTLGTSERKQRNCWTNNEERIFVIFSD